MFQSILRGCGQAHIPSFYNILMTVLVTIPVAYICSFTLGMGVIGLWIGIFCFQTIMAVISFIYCYNLDIKAVAKELRECSGGEVNKSKDEWVILKRKTIKNN